MAAALLGRQFATEEGESLFIADVAVRQVHTIEGKVTRHPVEDGGSISDHVTCEPECLEMTMEVSNFPVCGINPNDPNVGFASGTRRIENAYQQLKRIKKEKRVFNVQTKLNLYKNMVIESINVAQDADSCNILRFNARLCRVDIVGSEVSQIANVANENLRAPVNRGDVIPPRAVETFCDRFVNDGAGLADDDPLQGTFAGSLIQGLTAGIGADTNETICECDVITDFIQREECLRARGIETNAVISAGDL